MPASALANVIEFFNRIGIYDVVLPFLLTFTITFAILERSKVLGTEKVGGADVPRKNLNSMAAFVIGFLVVASSKLVEVITKVSSQVVVLILLCLFFLVLVGMFTEQGKIGEKGLENKWWNTIFSIIVFLGVVLIFLNAITTDRGTTWLQEFVSWLNQFWTSAAVGSIILIILIIGFIVWVTHTSEAPKGDKK